MSLFGFVEVTPVDKNAVTGEYVGNDPMLISITDISTVAKVDGGRAAITLGDNTFITTKEQYDVVKGLMKISMDPDQVLNME